MAVKMIYVGLRLTEDEHKKLEKIIARMVEVNPLMSITKSQLSRHIMLEGMSKLEEEFLK